MKDPRVLTATALAVCSIAFSGCSNTRTASSSALPSTNAAFPFTASAPALPSAPATGVITEYLIPTHRSPAKTYPVGITTGPDGAIWFAERGLGALGRITVDGSFGKPIKLKGYTRAPFPQNVAVGSDGNLWATCGTLHTYRQQSHGDPDPYGAIVRVTTTSEVTAFDLPTMYSDPRGIVAGPDGDLWFAERRGAIGRITTSGYLRELSLQHGHAAYPIAVGPDQNVWFGETFKRRIGRMTTDFDRPRVFKLLKNDGPYGIVSGPDGNLYISEGLTGSVGQVTTMGAVSAEWPLAAGSYPKGITVGSDGNLYVAEFGTGSIARVTLDGTVTEFAIPTPHSGPWGITSGPDGNIWFAESLVGKIGKLAVLSSRNGDFR